MYSFILIVSLILSDGSHYQAPAVSYNNFAECMNVAMNTTYSYRRSDLKEYKVMCHKITPPVNEE